MRSYPRVSYEARKAGRSSGTPRYWLIVLNGAVSKQFSAFGNRKTGPGLIICVSLRESSPVIFGPSNAKALCNAYSAKRFVRRALGDALLYQMPQRTPVPWSRPRSLGSSEPPLEPRFFGKQSKAKLVKQSKAK